MEDIEKNFISFLDNIPNIIKEIEVEKLKLPPKFNLIDCLERHTDEVKNSNIIKTVLEIKIIHDNKKISFAKLFIDYLNEKYLSENDKIKYSDKNDIEVDKEIATDEGRRIDILIEIDNNAIIIENKINAGDQPNQLNDYYKDRKKSKNVYVLYLTRNGEEPSESSLSEENRKELGQKFILISHGDIALWLENILENNVSFIKTDDKYKFIYSALVQVIENEKILSDMSEEDNMEKEVIENYVEKFISDKDIENTKEYAEILKQASDAFYHKYYFSFYEKLISYLDEKFKGIACEKFKGIAYEKSYDDELHSVIESIFINKNARYYKICYQNTKYTHTSIFLQLDSGKSIYGLLDGDGSRGGDREEGYVNGINKLNIRDLGYTRSDVWCSHYNIINEMVDSPKKIAEKMYNLYKLLKDNGF